MDQISIKNSLTGLWHGWAVCGEDYSVYLRLKPTSRKQFDRERRRTTLSSASMMKYYGVKRWRELIEVLGLPLYEKEKREVRVTARVDMDGEHFE